MGDNTRLIDSNIRNDWVVEAALDVASVAANTSAEQDFTILGLEVGDFVTVTKPSLSAGLGVVNARVKSENTLAITFQNSTGSAINPAEETYLIHVVRRDLDKPNGMIDNSWGV